MEDDDALLEDLKLDAELEGFLSGSTMTSGMVNLQPQPMSFGNSLEEGRGFAGGAEATTGAAKGEGGNSTAAALGAAAAAAGAAATALMGGKFSVMGGAVGSAVETMASAAIPTSLKPVKETAGKFLQKAQPWRDFVCPLSVPAASDGCSRLTANIYNFQTNYAILFVVQLVLAIILQPSALICIVMTVVVWMFFLKKNDDPDWAPTLGGVQLGPVQRWLLLAATTALVLLFVAGGAIINTAVMYVLFVFAHGIFHDPSAQGLPGSLSGSPVPL